MECALDVAGTILTLLGCRILYICMWSRFAIHHENIPCKFNTHAPSYFIKQHYSHRRHPYFQISHLAFTPYHGDPNSFHTTFIQPHLGPPISISALIFLTTIIVIHSVYTYLVISPEELGYKLPHFLPLVFLPTHPRYVYPTSPTTSTSHLHLYLDLLGNYNCCSLS